MDENLSDEQIRKADPIVDRANLDAWGARPGGDLIKIAGIMGKKGSGCTGGGSNCNYR
jgi:chondroitin AC lyase